MTDVQRNSRHKVAGVLLAANVTRSFGQIVVFTLIARVQGPDGAGKYALALAITAPIFILAGLGMRSVYLTIRKSISVFTYESLRTWTVTLGVFVSGVLALLLEPGLAWIVVVVAVSKAVDAYNDLYGAVLQKASRAGVTVRTSVVCTVAQAGSLAIALLAGTSLFVSLTISTLMYALATLMFVRRIALPAALESATSSEPVRRPWMVLIKAGFPMGLSFGLITLLSTMPQYFLGWEDHSEDVGRYASLMYIVMVGEMALNALAQSWIPHGRKLHEEQRLTAKTMLAAGTSWGLITVPLGALAIVLAVVAFPVAFGPTFAIRPNELWPLALAILVSPFVFVTATSLAIQNRYRFALVTSGVSVFAGAVLGWYLVGWYGVQGGLWTYTICLILRAGGGFAFVSPRSSNSSEGS